jgi:hypothetical protein
VHLTEVLGMPVAGTPFSRVCQSVPARQDILFAGDVPFKMIAYGQGIHGGITQKSDVVTVAGQVGSVEVQLRPVDQ